VQNLHGLTRHASLGGDAVCHSIHDGARLVGGPIVYGDDLQRNAIDCKQGMERRGDPCGFIPRRDNHA
jgi:hypothetical protein